MYIGDGPVFTIFAKANIYFVFEKEREDDLTVYPADTTDSRLWGGWFESDESLKARNGNYLGFLEARVITPFIKFLLSEEFFTLP